MWRQWNHQDARRGGSSPGLHWPGSARGHGGAVVGAGPGVGPAVKRVLQAAAAGGTASKWPVVERGVSVTSSRSKVSLVPGPNGHHHRRGGAFGCRQHPVVGATPGGLPTSHTPARPPPPRRQTPTGTGAAASGWATPDPICGYTSDTAGFWNGRASSRRAVSVRFSLADPVGSRRIGGAVGPRLRQPGSPIVDRTCSK